MKNQTYTNSKAISDLRLMLNAVNELRIQYRNSVELKLTQAVVEFQPTTESELKSLYSKVIGSSELNEQYQKLVNLYGIIGDQSAQYIEALNDLKVG